MLKKIAITWCAGFIGGMSRRSLAASNLSFVSDSASTLVKEIKPESIFVDITSIYYSHHSQYIYSLFSKVTGNNSSPMARATRLIIQ